MTTKQAASQETKIELTPLMKVGHAMVNQGMGLDTGLTDAQLEHIYADLEDELVCDEANALLIKLLGDDWNVRECNGCEHIHADIGDDEKDDEYELAEADYGMSQVLQETYDDCESETQVIRALSATLMNVAKEAGMEEVAMTACKIWFLH